MISLLKLILKIAGVVILLVAGLTLFVLVKPQYVVNEPVFRKLAPFMADFGYKFSWDEGKIQIESPSFFEKTIDIHFKNFCVDMVSVEASGCFEEIHMAATLDFKGRKFHLLDVGPIQIKSQKFEMNLKASKPSPSSRHGVFSEIISSETNYHDFNLNLKNMKYISGESDYDANITISDNGTLGHGKPWALSGFLSAQDQKRKASISGQFKLEGQKYLFAVPLKLVAKVKAEMGDKLSADAWVDLQFLREEAAEYQVQIDFQDGNELAIESRLKGLLDGDQTKGQIHGTITADGFKVPIGQEKDCSYDINFDGGVNVSCPFQVLPQKPLLKDLDISKDFSQIHFMTELSLDSENGLGVQGPWTGNAKLKVQTLGESSINISGELSSEFSKSALNAELIKKLMIKASIQIVISNFAKLVERLRTTPYAVPAPLNVLTGNLICKMSEEFKFSDLSVPFNCATKLKSSNQTLDLNLLGNFGLLQKAGKHKPKLDLSLVFENTQIALPRFGLKGPPPILPDSRFKKTLDPPKPDSETALEYAIHIDTLASKDIKILSNLAKSPVPLEIHMVVQSGAKAKGSVHVKDFSVQLFRRDAQIKYFDVYLGQNDEEPIHGMAEVHYTDYLVKIFLDGTVREPVIRFESVPPRGQNDIVSVLLFGRAADPSNTDQTSSVSNTEAAIADKAVGLASMYLLASTPIESIGYTSQSQTFTAKFHLAEGTSLNIGASDAGLKEVGVNRHLGGPWYAYTYIKNPSTSDDRSTAAFLQWVLRY